MRFATRSFTASALLFLLACGDDSGGVFGGGSPSSSSGTTTSATTGAGGEGGASTTSGTTTSSTSGAGGEGGGAIVTVDDPAETGPYAVSSLEAQVSVAATGNTFNTRAYYPTGGPSSGPYPVVLFGHGFQLAVSRYLSYGQHLASHGYVVVMPDFPAGFTGFTHVEGADDMLGALDWALAHATLGPLSDDTKIGTTGHSLGGKLAFLTAKRDTRIVAAIGLDPVDTQPFGCNATNCPDVSSAMPNIPMAVLGETLDGTGSFGQACAPTADNYVTFYNGAASPALEVTVLGADHMSFLDNEQNCTPCFACKDGTADSADVTALSRAFVTAFFQRRLRGLADYDTYLSGAEAQARYVATNQATIRAK